MLMYEMSDEKDVKEGVYSELDSETPITEVESLCPECEENGKTRLMLTRIPHYKDVILASFSCHHCSHTNNEIQSGDKIQERGVSWTLNLQNSQDLNRQVVKSDFASLTCPIIDLEIPSKTQKGNVTTVEGILFRVIEGLEQDQVLRKTLCPEDAQTIEDYVQRIRKLLEFTQGPFEIILRDISGNSYVQNPLAPQPDPNLSSVWFERSKEENEALGLIHEEKETSSDVEPDEVLTFPTNCPSCNAPAATNMKMTDIPYFKEVIIMATNCEYCGNKTNEIKSGGGIEPKGIKLTLKVTENFDLSRDVLKSESCKINIPDLEFEMEGQSIGGKFTTLEGLLINIKDQLDNNPFMKGDSAEIDIQTKLDEFRNKLQEFINGDKNFTFILDDPAGNSYIQNLYAPDPDPNFMIEYYERSFDQNEDLGLNDMKV